MSPVDQLIEAFGGIRPMADKLGEKHHTLIQGWKVGGNVPHFREPQIRAAAKKHRIRLPAKLMADVFPPREAEAA